MNVIAKSADVMTQAKGGKPGQGGVFSLTLAVVKNINDDKKLNRVKCLPIGAPEEEMTDWCYVMSPMGGKDRGLFLFPQVEDLVVLGYLENDPQRPIVLGSFWNTDTTPPRKIENNKAEDYCLVTPSAVELSLHDEKSKQKLTVKMPSGVTVEFDDEKQTLTAKNNGGDTSLLMKMKEGEIEVSAKSKLTLKAGQASILLEQNGAITIKGSGKVSIQGSGIEEKAQGQMSMQGADVTVKAMKDLNMSATATATLKGTLLKLN